MGHPSCQEHLQSLVQTCLKLEHPGLPKCCWNNNEVRGTSHASGHWRLKDLVLKQQLPKVLFPWPLAHQGLAELLSLMFYRSGFWGTGTCSCPAVEVSPSLDWLCYKLSSACVGATGSSAAGVPAASKGCSASHLGFRGVQLSSANRNYLKYRFSVLS